MKEKTSQQKMKEKLEGLSTEQLCFIYDNTQKLTDGMTAILIQDNIIYELEKRNPKSTLKFLQYLGNVDLDASPCDFFK